MFFQFLGRTPSALSRMLFIVTSGYSRCIPMHTLKPADSLRFVVSRYLPTRRLAWCNVQGRDEVTRRLALCFARCAVEVTTKLCMLELAGGQGGLAARLEAGETLPRHGVHVKRRQHHGYIFDHTHCKVSSLHHVNTKKRATYVLVHLEPTLNQYLFSGSNPTLLIFMVLCFVVCYLLFVCL